MKSKKYYTISEVTKILNIAASQLRYLEKTSSILKIIQLKGRRYYTIQNINFIKSQFNKTEIIQNLKSDPVNLFYDSDEKILQQINKLIGRFENALNQVENAITTVAQSACLS